SALGSTSLGFWFFQTPVTRNPRVGGGNGTFSGTRTVGDLFVVVDFGTGAEGTIRVYEWRGPLPGPATNRLRQITNISPDNLFVTVNTVSTPTGGWPFRSVSPPTTPPTGIFAGGQFIEGGLDVTALGLPDHFTSMMIETRASDSLTAN